MLDFFIYLFYLFIFFLLENGAVGKFVFAMDAIFGLPRKKSAGTSVRPPHYQGLFFEDQVLLDQFVSDNGSKRSGVKVDVSSI